jgi:hypothetical protein
MANRSSNEIDKYIEEIGKQICQEGNERLAMMVKTHVDTIIKESMEEFYATHTYHEPYSYSSTGSLATFARFMLNENDNSFYVEYGSELGEGGYRVDKDYIYKLVFLAGWHGGAYTSSKTDDPHPHPGIPYWRVPTPWGSFWSEPADRAPEPPVSILTRKWNEFVLNEYDKLKNEIENELLEKYSNKLSEYIIQQIPVVFDLVLNTKSL